MGGMAGMPGMTNEPARSLKHLRVDAWYSLLGAQMDEEPSSGGEVHTGPHLQPPPIVEQMRQALKKSALRTHGPCPSRRAWTCSPRASVRLLELRSTGLTSRRSKISAPRSRRCCQRCRAREVFLPERTSGGYFLDFKWNRDELARYGLSIDDAQDVIMSAIGGENVTTTIEGRERYPVNVRYMRDYRSDPDKLGRVLVPTMDGQTQVPLAQLAEIQVVSGPAMHRVSCRTARSKCMLGYREQNRYHPDARGKYHSVARSNVPDLGQNWLARSPNTSRLTIKRCRSPHREDDAACPARTRTLSP